MENSRKSVSDLAGRVADALVPALQPGSTILLALSGGVDSVVLLHLLHRLAPANHWQLSALHVHHGISPHADTWAEFCAGLCARHGIPFRLEQVDIAPLRDLGIEAAARNLRHAALDRQAADFIALAHHRNDQTETMLLQLLRGTGLRGASAMPPIRYRPPLPAQLRPLLNVARSELLDYARQHALTWVEDESNADDAYPRNFLRHRVLPILEQRFPACNETFARSARHFAEAAGLLDQLAQLDAQNAIHKGGLQVDRLRALSTARAKNLLRYYLHTLHAPMPHAAQLEDMLKQLCGARQDAAVKFALGNWQLGRFRDQVYAFPTLPEPEANFCVLWSGEKLINLPALGGTLHFDPVIGSGLRMDKLDHAAFTIRLRRGVERMRPDVKRPTRSLKNLFQEQAIPPWQRDRLPLLYCGESLVAIPGIGVECSYQATQQETGIALRWNIGPNEQTCASPFPLSDKE